MLNLLVTDATVTF